MEEAARCGASGGAVWSRALPGQDSEDGLGDCEPPLEVKVDL